MCCISIIPYPHLFSGDGEKLRKYVISLNPKGSFILTIKQTIFCFYDCKVLPPLLYIEFINTKYVITELHTKCKYTGKRYVSTSREKRGIQTYCAGEKLPTIQTSFRFYWLAIFWPNFS